MKEFSFYNSSRHLCQNAVERQKEFVTKLQELCDDLTQTENRLIGHQQQSNAAKSVGDLQQYQQENQVYTCASYTVFRWEVLFHKNFFTV